MRRISTRLTVAFLLATLLPAVPLSFVVRHLLERSLAPALDAGLENALQAGLEETRATLQRRRQAIETLAERLASDPAAVAAFGPGDAGREPRLAMLDENDLPLSPAVRDSALKRWPCPFANMPRS